MDNKQPETIRPSTTPVKPKPRRRKRSLVNFLLFIGIIAAIALFAWAEMQRRDAISRLETTEQELEEIRKSTETSAQAVADQVLSNLRQVMNIPETPTPTVATIVDVAALRESNEFYNSAENGDNLIITENRAILFNLESGRILDVLPVQINPNTPPPAPTEEPPVVEGEPASPAAESDLTPTITP